MVKRLPQHACGLQLPCCVGLCGRLQNRCRRGGHTPSRRVCKRGAAETAAASVEVRHVLQGAVGGVINLRFQIRCYFAGRKIFVNVAGDVLLAHERAEFVGADGLRGCVFQPAKVHTLTDHAKYAAEVRAPSDEAVDAAGVYSTAELAFQCAGVDFRCFAVHRLLRVVAGGVKKRGLVLVQWRNARLHDYGPVLVRHAHGALRLVLDERGRGASQAAGFLGTEQAAERLECACSLVTEAHLEILVVSVIRKPPAMVAEYPAPCSPAVAFQLLTPEAASVLFDCLECHP